MKKAVLLLILAVVMLQITSCGENSMYRAGKNGYTNVSAVKGVSFELVSPVVRNATAITNISEEMYFEPAQTYLYKDGESEYFLFNISSIVCIVQKGTNFGFSEAEDKMAALKEGNILGVFFTSPEKKLDYKESVQKDVYKIIATATAQVSITPELYNDFAGRLAVIYDGETEWAFFVGSIGEDYHDLDKDLRKTLDYMAAAFTLYEKPEEEEEKTPPVSLGGEEDVPEMEKDTDDEGLPQEKEEVSLPEGDNRKKTVALDNQKRTVRESPKAYYSDIYDLLPLGKMGYAGVYEDGQYQNIVVRADKVYRGEEAENIIKNAGAFFPPGEGCSWHAVHYVTDASDGSGHGYVNVRLRGMDGENLKFRGIEYTQRTYDIPVSDTEFYSFYAVPNGCREYVLEMGEGDGKGEEAVSSYYGVRFGYGGAYKPAPNEVRAFTPLSLLPEQE